MLEKFYLIIIKQSDYLKNILLFNIFEKDVDVFKYISTKRKIKNTINKKIIENGL